MKAFFDLDGTLIDSKNRLYALFMDLVKQVNFTYEQYWSIKRNKTSHKIILMQYFNYSQKQYDCFERQWLDMIECDNYLALDKVYDGVCDILEKHFRTIDFYVITARQSKTNTVKQLEKLGLLKYFKKVFITENKVSKRDLLKSEIEINQKDILVSDTGFDILIGKNLGMKTIAVAYGFLSKEVLLEYKPDIVINDFCEIEKFIKS